MSDILTRAELLKEIRDLEKEWKEEVSAIDAKFSDTQQSMNMGERTLHRMLRIVNKTTNDANAMYDRLTMLFSEQNKQDPKLGGFAFERLCVLMATSKVFKGILLKKLQALFKKKCEALTKAEGGVR